MKKIFTLATLIFAFITNQTFAQNGCAWAKKTGGTNEDWGSSVTADNFGNVYYLGNFYSTTVNIGGTNLQNEPATFFNFGAEMFLAKFDSCGTFKWARRAGGNYEMRAKSVATDAAGNVFVCGYSRSDTTKFGTIKMVQRDYYDGFVTKYDANGTALWVTRIDGDYHDRAISLVVDNGGNVLVTGYFSSSYLRCGTDSVANRNGSSGYEDIFIVKLDNNGNSQWVRGGNGDYDDYANAIGTDAAGNVYVAGGFGSSYIRFGNDSTALSGYYDIFIVKYDASGNEQWLRTAGNTSYDEAFGLATDPAGNSYITGFTGYNSTVTFGTHPITNTNSSYGFFIAKYDASGTAQWARKGQGNSWTENHGTSVKLDAAGDAYVTGFYNSDSLQLGAVTLLNRSLTGGAMTGGDTAFDAFVMKYKANGVLSWARTYGGDDHEFPQSIATGNNNALYFTGEYRSASITFNSTTLTSTNTQGDAFIANNLSTNSTNPDICLVSSDSTSTNNIVYWDKVPYLTADSFIIYREVSTGIYSKIGIQPYSALSQFTDTVRSVGPANGDPNVGTYRYKIQIKDTAETYGAMGPYHNSIYFVNSNGTFTWNMYSVENMTVTPVSNFNLLRDDNANGMWNVIGTVAGTQTTLNDPAYTTYSLTADWRVQALGFNCNPTMRYENNAIAGAIIKSKSNITNNRGIGVESYQNKTDVIVYPNPASNSLYVESNKELGAVSLLNAMGQVVLKISSKNQSEQIDISKLPAGMYILQVREKFGKIIKE